LEGRIAGDTDLAWFGRKMSAWQTTTVYPVALQLGADGVSQSTRKSVTKLLYSYIVRRALCGLTTKNLNNVFQGIALRFHQDGASIEGFRSFFDGRSGDSIRFPNDGELRAGILTGNAYAIAPQPRLVDILWELEIASRSNFAEKHERPAGLWVEHVMPQTWTEKWPFVDGDYVEPFTDDPRSAARRSMVNSLGNLTLITGALNISAGNRGFDEKKDKFAEHTGLFLNKWFVSRDAWNEDDIRERGERLSDLAAQIWPNLESHFS
jgi:hypothetical protein